MAGIDNTSDEQIVAAFITRKVLNVVGLIVIGVLLAISIFYAVVVL
jgi:hypothetical protein